MWDTFSLIIYFRNHQLKPDLCPCTPPPSPSQARARPERNLVLISTLLVDPSAPNFATKYQSTQRSTSVDFNCLDLVISIPSWVVVIDFFGGNGSTNKYSSNVSLNSTNEEAKAASIPKNAKVRGWI